MSQINRESVDAIRTAIQELEKAGYIIRRQLRDPKGKLANNEYIIYEQPHTVEDSPPETDAPSLENPTTDAPSLDFPSTDNPSSEKPSSEKPSSENPTQLNKDISSKDINKKKSKKRKSADGLSDQEMQKLFVDWIQSVAPESWTPQVKNRLYAELVDFYKPRQNRKSEPARDVTQFGKVCNMLLRESGGHPDQMIRLLEKATGCGWKMPFGSGGTSPPRYDQQEEEGVVHL